MAVGSKDWRDCAQSSVNGKWWDPQIWRILDLMMRIKGDQLLLLGRRLNAFSGSLNVKITPHEPMDITWVPHINELLRLVEDVARPLELAATLAKCEMMRSIIMVEGVTNAVFDMAINQVTSCLQKQLSECIVVAIDPLRTIYVQEKEEFLRSPSFGSSAIVAFPSIGEDIYEACLAYGLYRSASCIYHSMRILEIGLKALADKLSVQSDLTNWKNIIDQIEKAIKDREQNEPKSAQKNKDLTFYSSVAVQFRYFKNAWRNHVAHGSDEYNDGDAKRVLDHVLRFMTDLAEGGLKEQP